jgi:hypothetical protein
MTHRDRENQRDSDPEIPDNLMSQAQRIVKREYRPAVMVAGLVIGGLVALVIGLSGANGYANGYVLKVVDDRVGAQLADHEKRLGAVEKNSQETHDVVLELRVMLQGKVGTVPDAKAQ